MARRVPASSTMAVPHGAAGVGTARRRLRAELLVCGMPAAAIDDALLILSELLSNAGRHARPLCSGTDPSAAYVRADWHRAVTGELTISVTDGGGPTRPRPGTPSVSAHGGRGLTIITTLADSWGVQDWAYGERQLDVGTAGRDTAGRAAGDPDATQGTTGRGITGSSGLRPADGRPESDSSSEFLGCLSGGRSDDTDGHPPGVTVWAVLTPIAEESDDPGEPHGAESRGGTTTGLGGAFAGVDLLAELDEPA